MSENVVADEELWKTREKIAKPMQAFFLIFRPILSWNVDKN